MIPQNNLQYSIVINRGLVISDYWRAVCKSKIAPHERVPDANNHLPVGTLGSEKSMILFPEGSLVRALQMFHSLVSFARRLADLLMWRTSHGAFHFH